LRNLKSEGRCIVLSSHVMQEVAALCDQAVIIGRGRVLAQGSLLEIRGRSASSTLEEAFLEILGDDGGLG
jgi:sodium transport system ATP-binding protein